MSQTSFAILICFGGFFIVLGSLIFLVDCFKVSWKWGLAVLLLPPVGIAFLIKHWSEGKRGFTLIMLAVPLLAVGYIMQPKPAEGAKIKEPAVKDPFAEMMNKARDAVAKVQQQRSEIAPIPGAPKPAPTTGEPTPVGSSTVSAAPTPPLTLDQRLAANRKKFKQLATDFAALEEKRSKLPKNDLNAIHAFNEEAALYTKNLQDARSEQDDLLALQKSGSH